VFCALVPFVTPNRLNAQHILSVQVEIVEFHLNDARRQYPADADSGGKKRMRAIRCETQRAAHHHYFYLSWEYIRAAAAGYHRAVSCRTGFCRRETANAGCGRHGPLVAIAGFVSRDAMLKLHVHAADEVKACKNPSDVPRYYAGLCMASEKPRDLRDER
jgi:hypothetical protein